MRAIFSQPIEIRRLASPPIAQIPTSGATAPPLAPSHAIIAVGAYNTVSTSVSAYLNIAKDGGNLAEVNREAPNIASYQDAGLAQQEALSAISTTWKWRARSAGTTVNIGNLAIAVPATGGGAGGGAPSPMAPAG